MRYLRGFERAVVNWLSGLVGYGLSKDAVQSHIELPYSKGVGFGRRPSALSTRKAPWEVSVQGAYHSSGHPMRESRLAAMASYEKRMLQTRRS